MILNRVECYKVNKKKTNNGTVWCCWSTIDNGVRLAVCKGIFTNVPRPGGVSDKVPANQPKELGFKSR